LYIDAGQIAKKLSEVIKDKKESGVFKEYYTKLSDKATSYGSLIKSKIPDTSIDDVKGLQEAKDLIKSFIFISKHSDLLDYYKLNGGLGLLMYGAPGTGKTMFAEAIANAMGLPLFIVTPADIFKSYVGASEQAVKEIFQEIDNCKDGAILFIDECESIFSKRDNETKDYKAAVTTELLQRMNGFGINGVKRIMIAATNRPDVIDPAYLRYKRFSHLVHISPPDMVAKKAIIESKLKGIDLADDITIDDIVEMTNKAAGEETNIGYVENVLAYYSAADICGIIEETARIAMRIIEESKSENSIPLTRTMFEKAFKKIGPSISRQSMKFYEDFNKLL